VNAPDPFELNEAHARFNNVFGLLAAIDSIDRVIEIIRKGQGFKPAARLALISEKLPDEPGLQNSSATSLLTFEYKDGILPRRRGYVDLERPAGAGPSSTCDWRGSPGSRARQARREATELKKTIETSDRHFWRPTRSCSRSSVKERKRSRRLTPTSARPRSGPGDQALRRRPHREEAWS